MRGHRWLKCTRPLKPTLQERKRQLQERWARRANENTNNYDNTKENKNSAGNNASNSDNKVVRQPTANENLHTAEEIQISADVVSKSNEVILYARIAEEWLRVNGKLDSGADVTVGSLPNHGRYCVKVWNYVGRPIIVKTADNTKHYIKAKGLVRLRANSRDLGLVEVLLVDTGNWNNLLVGRDIMIQQGLLNCP